MVDGFLWTGESPPTRKSPTDLITFAKTEKLIGKFLTGALPANDSPWKIETSLKEVHSVHLIGVIFAQVIKIFTTNVTRRNTFAITNMLQLITKTKHIKTIQNTTPNSVD